MSKTTITPPINFPNSLISICKELISESALIPEERRVLLQPLVNQILEERKSGLPVNITVICTHNSRRSHIGQLWLQAAAIWFGIDNISTFSGGTEATAFNLRSVKALQDAGFPLDQQTTGENPIYHCRLDSTDSNLPDLFSKKYDTPPNPTAAFLAILVCGEAEEACPYIPGAKARFYLPFKDPKEFDDSEWETQAYSDKVKEIGREFLWVMEQVYLK